jgi:hypothetical protein
MKFAACWQRWRQFWFEPKSPLPLAIFRILFGLIALQNALLHTWPGLLSWYGTRSVVSIDTVIGHCWEGLPRFDLLLLLPPGDQWVIGFFWAYVLSIFFLTVGFGTRYSAAFMALALISFRHHDVFNLHGGDSFERLAAIFLAFSPAGELLSVDSRLKRRQTSSNEPPLYSPWAQRMLQVQIALIYGHSFLSKLFVPQWLDGTAVYYATRIDNLVHLPMSWLFDSLVVCKALTWYTLLVEFCMFTLVWLKKFRYIVLAADLVLHLGIDAALSVPVYEWLMIVSLVNFVEPEDLASWISSAKRFILGKSSQQFSAD